MPITDKDKIILREIGKQVAEIAALPVQKKTITEWKRLNSLKPGRPLVWINEIPWHEMNINDELTLRTEDGLSRSTETWLRRLLYQYRHMRADMVVEPVVYSPVVIRDTGFGITMQAGTVADDASSEIVSRHFSNQIKTEEDIYEKVKKASVAYDEEKTEENYKELCEVFEGILRVEKQGITHWWFAPWDYLVQWYGVEDALIDLRLNPEFLHKLVKQIVDVELDRLDQYEKQNLLALNNGNYRIGSGGPGYTDELPAAGFDGTHVRACDTWGNSTAQIFVGVSPEMYEEFSFQYELQWLKRFGMTYYGCCEPLHRKIHILDKIPNLRKISMSRWIDVDEAAEVMGDRYVFSYKPNPGYFAGDSWDIDGSLQELRNVLDKAKARNCIVEVIMKDISTVAHKPQRIWEWADKAAEIVKRY